MNRIRLTSIQDPMFHTAWKLYQDSFPRNERRSLSHQQTAFQSVRYHMEIFTEQDKFIGLIGYWTFNEYVYVEHLAVNPALRSGGYGSRIVSKFLSSTNRTIILEIEQVTDNLTARRLRFYERQFITRSSVNKSVVIKFDELLDDYFHSGKTQSEGLPTVKYFADRICLSPNYFGDLIKKETGRTAQEYIQGRIMDAAKDMIIGTDKSVSEIAYSLGFQYPQHFSRVFKKHTGNTPNEYRHAGYKDSASM